MLTAFFRIIIIKKIVSFNANNPIYEYEEVLRNCYSIFSNI